MTESTPQTEIRIVHRFDAPPDRVYRAWCEPGDLKQWAWGSISGNVTAEVDLRVGGKYRITNIRPEETVAFTGEFLEIVPDRKLVYSVQWEAEMGYEPVAERVTVEFTKTDGGTEIVFVHEGGFPAEAVEPHKVGWTDTFKRLAGILHP